MSFHGCLPQTFGRPPPGDETDDDTDPDDAGGGASGRLVVVELLLNDFWRFDAQAGVLDPAGQHAAAAGKAADDKDENRRTYSSSSSQPGIDPGGLYMFSLLLTFGELF